MPSLLAALTILYSACQKYQDPPPTQGDERLTNPYCNDPRAVNYNWGFPGKPDSTLCVFPIDKFIGTWAVEDSIFSEDDDFLQVENKVLAFYSLEDSLFQHLAIKGWCGSDTLFARASKFGRATIDTIGESVNGQIICDVDTMSGFFNFGLDQTDTLDLNFIIRNESGTTIHKGRAIKE